MALTLFALILAIAAIVIAIVAVVLAQHNTQQVNKSLRGFLHDFPHPKMDAPNKPNQSQQMRPLILQVDKGASPKGPFVSPSLGEANLVTYDPDDYAEPLHCCTCGRQFESAETFWAIDMPDYPGGLLGVCSLCYGKAVSNAR